MKRYSILDEIRGFTLCSMILYHAVWDLVYLYGMDWAWYRSGFAYVWQQSICWSFILLSGFCFSLGKRKWRRGLVVLGAGEFVTIVTGIIMPGQSIRFGVLTMLGTSMLILALLEKIISVIRKSNHINWAHPGMGMCVAGVLFFCTRGINDHYLGFEGVCLLRLPGGLYMQNDLMTFIGFLREGFYSTDYFSIIPWFFLFLMGYFFYHLLTKKQFFTIMEEMSVNIGLFRRMGRHSLLIYLFHQPLIYLFLSILTKIVV